MKKLLSEAAIRAKRIFLAIASFFSTLWAKVLSTFRKSKNAEAKTTYSLNNKSSAGGAGKHVSAAGGKKQSCRKTQENYNCHFYLFHAWISFLFMHFKEASVRLRSLKRRF